MALKAKTNTNIIHHSDRGLQYCSYEYTDLIKQANITISMTQQGDPYENALAERINRTIKEDMLLNQVFINFEMAQKAVQKAIENYNHFRPHRSCGYLTAPAARPWTSSPNERRTT